MKNKKVIIWGYPLYSHTLSYCFYGFYKAFKYLGYDVIWTENSNGVDFSNSFILTERWPAAKLPLEKTSTYVVHMLGNKPEAYDLGGPARFLGNVKRLIDFRMHGTKGNWDDPWYSYSNDKSNMESLVDYFYYQNDGDYEKIYTPWATDLLPHEINLDDRFIKRENKIYYFGTIGGGLGGLDTCKKAPDCFDNVPALSQFKIACDENNIELITNCPWQHPMTFEECQKLIQISYLAPDFRHPAMSDWGYIPCRTFKNISYGQVGMTNSEAVNEFFNYTLICDKDPYKLFYKGLDSKENFELIKEQMIYIRNNHTYINRVNGLIKLMEMEM